MKKLALLMLFAIGACGDDSARRLPDAPPGPDAEIDAPPPNTPVTLTITLDGQPVPGVDVYFVNPDASLVARTSTDAAGQASAIVLAGASVTAVNPFEVPLGAPAPRDLRTFMGVKPGDQLRLTEQFTPPTSINVTVVGPAHATADQFDLYTSCSNMQSMVFGGSGASPSVLFSMAGCNGTADMLIAAFQQGVLVGWLYKPGVAVADNATIDLSADAYQTTNADVTFTFTNIPQAFTQLDGDTLQASSRGEIWRLPINSNSVTNGTATRTFTRPPVANAHTVTRAALQDTQTLHEIYNWGPATLVTFDLAGAVLHGYTTAPAYDLTSRMVTWAASGGVAPDYTTIWLDIGRPSLKVFFTWQIVAPYGGTALTLPSLPATAFPFVPDATDDAFFNLFASAKVPGGYDAVRANALDNVWFENLVGNATGRISVATYQPIGVRKAPRTQFKRPARVVAGPVRR